MSFSITSNVQSAPKTNEEIKLEHELIAGRVAHLREQEKTLQDHTDAIAAAEKHKAELVFRSQELKQEVSRLTDEKARLAREVEIEQSSPKSPPHSPSPTTAISSSPRTRSCSTRG